MALNMGRPEAEIDPRCKMPPINPKRTTADIKEFTVYTAYHDRYGAAGWVVNLMYRDGKRALFTIDVCSDQTDMLQHVADCIKKQLKGTKK